MWDTRLTLITPKQHQQIIELREGGMTLKDIAKRFGVSIGQVYRALNNEVKRNRLPDPPKAEPLGA